MRTRYMYSLDLSSGKSEYLPLAVPLLIHDGLYYYNKQQNNGHYCLMAYDIGTNGEKEILNYPAYSIDAFNNTLFITEGTERLGDVTAGIIIDLDINSTKYYLINTAVGEAVELSEAFFKGTDAQIKLIAEYEDYYIFIYSSLNEGISRRIGYIRKNDFLNGSDKYILAAPM